MNGLAHGRRWSRDEITAALLVWQEEHGEPPTAAEWRCGSDGLRPSYNAVVRHFGSWGKAMQAAGVKVRRPGDFRLNREGRRPTCERRFLDAWARFTSTRTVDALTEAQQRALLDPELRDLVIGQIIDQQAPHVLPKIVRATREVRTSELRFETPVEPSFEPWLVSVMDFRRLIDEWSA